MKTLSILCFWLMCCCAGMAQAQSPEPDENERVAADAQAALWWADFDELERQHALYQQAGQRTASGRSKLVLFRRGLGRVMNGPERAIDAYFVQMEALTLQWAQARPASALAHVLHAAALVAHAWSYRGSGYANTVPPEAWRDFERYIAKATDYLAKHEAVALSSSSGHVELLNLGKARGWQPAALWSIAQAGLARNVDDEGLYRDMLTAVLPKWGGSTVLVDRVINDIAKLTAPLHGDIYYSRMYAWAADAEFHHQIFKDTGASWPRMKAGYEQMLVRYPAPVNVNSLAYFACLARDKPALIDLLERIGPKPHLDVWGKNASRTFETCKRFAAES